MSVDPLADKYPGWNPYHYTLNNPVRLIDPDGRAPDDIILRGANNSSVTIKTDLIDIKLDASSFVGDLGGNHTLSGKDALITGLDLVGIVDPTPISDGLSASLSLENGDYLGAGASLLGTALPFVGDLAKGPKIAKGIAKIKAAIKSDKEVDVFRVFGGKSKAEGFSFTTVNPNSVDNFRDVAGLPNVNTGRFVLEGTAKRSDIIKSRRALPLDGNKGGLQELIINPKNVNIKRVSGANPEF